MYWIFAYVWVVALKLFLCSWYSLLSISYPFAGFRLCPRGIDMQVEDAWVPEDSLLLPRFNAWFWSPIVGSDYDLSRSLYVLFTFEFWCYGGTFESTYLEVFEIWRLCLYDVWCYLMYFRCNCLWHFMFMMIMIVYVIMMEQHLEHLWLFVDLLLNIACEVWGCYMMRCDWVLV